MQSNSSIAFQSHYTALTLAARYGETDVCQLLFSNGANVNNQTTVNDINSMQCSNCFVWNYFLQYHFYPLLLRVESFC